MAGKEIINTPISENLRKSFAMANCEIKEDNDKFQADKNCAVCQIAFGIIGIVHAKKYLCKFCYRGVCNKCSPEKFVHPIDKQECRICVACVEKVMEKSLSVDYKKKLSELMSERDMRKEELGFMIREKQIDMSHNQYIEQQINTESQFYTVKLKELKSKVNNMMDSQEGIRMQHKKLKDEHAKYISDMNKKKELILNLEKSLESLKSMYENNKQELPNLRNRMGELQDIELKIKSQIKEKLSIARSLTLNDKEQKLALELDEIKHKIHVADEERMFFIAEIEKLEKENMELEEKIEVNNIRTRTKSSDGLALNTSSGNYNLDEEMKVKELREKSSSNQQALTALRVKLEAQKIMFRKANMSTDMVPEPGSRPCARCILQ
ncbi:hypothetical protein SteCoe_35151 [Stentor coeruleus]|uniref:FYVE-type domain-containing protein n=1 Tax=Stentor coeruleus TaxID=5963 RepID=A0A1R2ATA2_9CILI|nr:hypothetical protein SteCoe_35151 [Stentor coeruleus]